MAIYFFKTRGSIDGYMIHHSVTHEMYIGIEHRLEDGYKPSFDGDIIKEKLSIDEFVNRLVTAENHHKNMHSSELYNMETDIRRKILVALSKNDEEEIKNISKWLDYRYSNLIRNGKAVLMEHTHSINAYKTMVNKYPVPIDEAFKSVNKISDKDVYYLLT